MLAAFHPNLTALSWIALIVGLFLVYNTVTISVVARRQEIGTLRALGLSRRNKVLLLFLGEAAALAVAGIAIGLGLARLLADAAVTMTASTVSTLYIAAASAPPEMNSAHRLDRDRDRPAAVAARRRHSGARSQPRAADGGDARPRHARHARALQAGGVDRRARVPAGRLRARAATADRPPAGLRLHVVVRDRDRRARSLVPAIMYGLARARPADAAPAARRRGPARARQPDVGHPAPVDLGRRAVGQPVDDGGDRGHDRQLPRHGRLLGRPDAAGRPLHRPGHPADRRLGADGVART